jgi:methylated-DNA-[protein]-cysteine S-methyltransferase
MTYREMETPIGPLLMAGDAAGLRYLLFARGRDLARPDPAWLPEPRGFREPVRQLTAYFAGRLREFDFPLAPQGTTFQSAVWQELRRIPYGETISYGELARRLGNPKAVRAVGLANGSNPISIVIPCHRVIGSTGSLVGYGGGLPIKQALLALERGQHSLL